MYTILCIRYKLKIDLYCTVATYYYHYYYYADYDDDCYRLIINSIERTRWDGFFRLNDHTTAAYVIIETRLHINLYRLRLRLIIVYKCHHCVVVWVRDFGNKNNNIANRLPFRSHSKTRHDNNILLQVLHRGGYYIILNWTR